MGILYIVSTPIGNMGDLTLRAVQTLFSVNVIACEDTRKTGLLLDYIRKNWLFDLKKKIATPASGEARNDENVSDSNPTLISFYDEVEMRKIPEMLNLLLNDKNVALVSDAGTPLISDPGFKLVRECLINNIKVVSVPGPSSVISALSVSGLPTDKFSFYGFLPEKKSHALKLLENIKESEKLIKTTNIFFASPYKIIGNLEALLEIFGDIEIVIARELTKVYEEVKKEKISELLIAYKNKKPKGEFVILFNN